MSVKFNRSKANISLVRHIRKKDTQKVASLSPLEVEDEFNSFYTGSKNNSIIIQPPFVPAQLKALSEHNNILQQAVHVMEVNVDGTGHQMALIENMAEDESQKKRGDSFFKTPFAGQSFITIRRSLRFDLETTGNAYLEVLRNAAGELKMVRHIDSSMIRMVRLDEPVMAEKTLERDGKEETLSMWVRERRFVQKVGAQKLVYFREYGSSREVDRDTGDWTTDKNSLSLEKRGSELIHFTVDKDAKTPYGVPRWINQLPSVLGSRKSEIFNLDFFDSGGLPPALVFVEGGSLGKAVLEQLNLYLSGKANAKQRVAVVEVPASAGTIESVGKVNVKVERFGDSRTGDSLFQTYDSNCEQRTRAAFRLPALFFGKEQSYNFATAMTAYMVTEAQVFAPERLEFDEIINRTIMQELGIRNYEFKSMPITLHNAELQLKALNLIQGKVESEDVVNTINDITGLTLQYSEEAEAKNNPFGGMNPFEEEEEDEDDEDDVSGQPKNKFKPGLGKPDRGLPVIKSERLTANGVVQLAAHWITAMGLEKNGHKYSDVEKAQVINKVESLNGEARQLFNSILAARGFGSTGNDGLEELAGQCCEILSRGHTH